MKITETWPRPMSRVHSSKGAKNMIYCIIEYHILYITNMTYRITSSPKLTVWTKCSGTRKDTVNPICGRRRCLKKSYRMSSISSGIRSGGDRPEKYSKCKGAQCWHSALYSGTNGGWDTAVRTSSQHFWQPGEWMLQSWAAHHGTQHPLYPGKQFIRKLYKC